MDRAYEHLYSFKNERRGTLITDHYKKHGNFTEPFTIHILDFIKTSNEMAKSIRLKKERDWIYRMQTMHPDGLNYLE